MVWIQKNSQDNDRHHCPLPRRYPWSRWDIGAIWQCGDPEAAHQGILIPGCGVQWMWKVNSPHSSPSWEIINNR